MKYPYNQVYEPPFPSLSVMLSNHTEGIRTAAVDALVDSGSDGTLVPVDLLGQIIAPVFTQSHIRSHWGEWRDVDLFIADLILDERLTLPGVIVIGDEQGDEIILGRNVLNKLRLRLDGPARFTEILTR